MFNPRLHPPQGPRAVLPGQVTGFRDGGRKVECPRCGALSPLVLVEVRAEAPKSAALCPDCNVFWEMT